MGEELPGDECLPTLRNDRYLHVHGALGAQWLHGIGDEGSVLEWHFVEPRGVRIELPGQWPPGHHRRRPFDRQQRGRVCGDRETDGLMRVMLRGDDGQVLPLALAFLVFFGLVIGGLLTFASASVLASERLREQRNTVYGADGATDAAIQYARLNAAVGAYGTPPFTAFSVTLNGVSVTVKSTSI